MIVVVAGICFRDGRVLLAQRPAGKHLAGLWEFPGGKLEADEAPQTALAREFKEELDVTISDPQPYTFAYHRYKEATVLLLFYTCRLEGEPAPQEDNPITWAPLATLDPAQFPPADRELVLRLRSHPPA